MNIKINLYQLKVNNKKFSPDIEIKVIDDDNKEIYYHTNTLLPSKNGNKMRFIFSFFE